MDLSHTQLEELPNTIGNLTKLQILRLSENHNLHKLPESIGQLVSLHILDLNGAQLKELPPSMGQLTRLTYLNLSNNQLTRLPASMVVLRCLKAEHLCPNKWIDNIPKIPYDIVLGLGTIRFGTSSLNSLSAICIANLAKYILVFRTIGNMEIPFSLECYPPQNMFTMFTWLINSELTVQGFEEFCEKLFFDCPPGSDEKNKEG